MGDFLEFGDVVQEIRGATHSGRLKLQSNMVVFKNLKTGVVEQFQATDVDKTSWLLRARGYCLKIMLKNGAIHRFDGFKESDFVKLAAFMTRCYKKDLEKVDLSVRGWNWGVTKFLGNALEFEIQDKLAFEIPLANVSHCTTAKNEVTLEFHQNDDAAVSLLEVRFHIPQDANSEKDAVDEFYDNVMKKADILQATGDAICLFSEVQCLTPRGRYDIKLYSSFLQLHGKTFDYKIPFSTVIRLFLLPHKDNRQMYFVVSLDPPIKQGQTRYHFLILLFNKDDETTLELGLSEKDLAEKYEGKLSKEMSGLEYEIVSKLMKALLNKKVTVPTDFVGHSGTKSVDCAYKSSNGFLYPLDRGFVYVHKPPFYVRFDEISCVNFGRNSGNNRFFDFDVETKTGTVHSFSSIAKEEYAKLFDFVKEKGLRVKNIGNKETVPAVDDMLGSDQEDEHDAYLLRMQQEGREAEAAASDDDSEDESEDEDFKPTEAPSDVAEEFDTSASSSEEEDEDGSKSESKENGEKKKKKTEPRKKTAKAPSEGGAKRKRKEKKVKDPLMPKRPQSAYFLWLNETREKIKQEHPGLSITEISKVAGEKWKTVTEKSKWEAAAKKAKEDYEKAMAEYKKNQAEATSSAAPAASSKGSDSDDTKASRKTPAKKTQSSPAKKASAANDSKAGAGDAYKSKEFISSSEGSSSSEADKPAQKKVKKEQPTGTGSSSEEADSDASSKPKAKKASTAVAKAKPAPAKTPAAATSGSDSDKPSKKKPKKEVAPKQQPAKKAPPAAKKPSKKESESEEEEESEVGSLPSDEEILSSPEASATEESSD